MALLTFDDLRIDSLAEFAAGCALGEDEASDANITAAITRLTARLQDWTNDLYTSTGSTTIDVNSDGGCLLYLPYRTTAVTSVTFRLSDGTYTAAQNAASYGLSSSLNSAGDTAMTDHDYLEVMPYSVGFAYSATSYWDIYRWPAGPRIVRVTGTFGYLTPPGDAKEAVAKLVWNHFKPIRADLGRAVSWQAGDTAVTNQVPDDNNPSGIPDVDKLIRRLRRNNYAGVS